MMWGGFGRPRARSFVFKAVYNTQGWWGVLAVPGVLKLSKQSDAKRFLDMYEITAAPTIVTPEIDRAFPLPLASWPSMELFQRKALKPLAQTSVDEICTEFRTLLNEHVEAYLYPGYFSGTANFRMASADTRPMNEEMAIYIVMFYLSSVVRYRPEYLQRSVGKSENWLLESFVRSCSVKFLRHFVSRIEQQAIILERI